MMRYIARLLRDNRGQGTVELALVLPVLIFILFGIIEFGRVFNEMLVVTAAAREGARVAAVGASQTTVGSTVRAFAASIDRGQLQVVITPSALMPGQPVTVSVTNPVPIVTPLISVFFPENPYIVRGTAVMRVE